MTNKLEKVKDVLIRPNQTIHSPQDQNVRYYFRYYKDSKAFLIVVVKYLNGDGFVITAFMATRVVV